MSVKYTLRKVLMSKSVMSQIQEAIEKNRNEATLKHSVNLREFDHLRGKADGLEYALKLLVSNLSSDDIIKLWETK